MSAVAIGDALPDVALLTPAGETVGLASLVRGQPSVLIHMRHLGCLPCREHLFEVARRRDELGEARVLCVTFVGPPLLREFEQELGIDGIELYGDPARATYAALGFGRASFARVWLHPAVWWRYATLIARGRRPHPPGQDVLQLGGDAVIDATGRVRRIFASRGPEDRPEVDELIAALSS